MLELVVVELGGVVVVVVVGGGAVVVGGGGPVETVMATVLPGLTKVPAGTVGATSAVCSTHVASAAVASRSA